MTACKVSWPLGLAGAAGDRKRLTLGPQPVNHFSACHSAGVVKWSTVLIYPDFIELI